MAGAGNLETPKTSGIAQTENHVVVLKVEVDFRGVSPGMYFLGLQGPGLEWTRFQIRVL